MTATPGSDFTPGGAATQRGVLVLVALYVLLYLLPLPVRPLASPDEVRYGEIAREMLVSGDWVSPHFNGVRYFEKPVLGHWLNALSLAAFGDNAFALRLPVALATGLAALIVFALSRRFLGASAAVLSTAIFLTTFLVAGVGTFALLDAFLALFLTAALAAYYLALRAASVERRAWLIACGAACGAAFLVKGFLALAIPVIVAAPFLVAGKRWRDLVTSPWWPIAVAVVVALPWSVLVHLREPDFWRYFFWVEHVQRFTAADAQHAAPFWYYVAYLPLTGWPWILLLPAAVIGLRRGSGGDRDFVRYLIIWAALPFLFFSVSSGKLATYILPCFAPLSILLAAGLERYLAAGYVRAWRFAGAAVVLAFVAVLALVIAAQRGAFGGVPFGVGEGTRFAVVVGSLAAGAAGGVAALWNRGTRPRASGFVIAGAALLVPLHFALPHEALDNVAPARAVARYAAGADAVVVSDAPLFGTAAWALKRNDIYVMSAGEIDYGLSYPDARRRLLDGPAFAALLEANRGQRDVVLVCVPSTEEELKALLPSSARREQQGNVIVWRVPAA